MDLLKDLKMPQEFYTVLNLNFILIYIIHKFFAVLKNQLNYLKNNIFECFFKKYDSPLFFLKKIISFYKYTLTYSDCLGDRYTGLGAQTLALKRYFSIFLFSLYFNKKCVEVAINDFTMHLIILKWLRRQNADRRATHRHSKMQKRKKKLSSNFFFFFFNTYCIMRMCIFLSK